MLWFPLALIAHLGNGLVFVVDKSLLNTDSTFGRPLVMTFYSGLVSALAIVLLFFDFAWPTPFAMTWSVISGFFFLIALWFFFSALKAGEPSRVVPMIGSAVPLFTLLFATTTLGERLSGQELIATVLLVAGGVFLSVRLSGAAALPSKVVLYIVVGGALFAAHFAAVKYLYSHYHPFLAGFAYSRFSVGVLALLLFGPLVMWQRKRYRRRVKRGASGGSHWKKGYLAAVFLGNKSLATGSLILQNYAISLGSVTLVNALQGTQYLFVLLLAVAVSRWFPQLFQEELRRVALVQKLIGIGLVSVGLLLLL